jgi:hypothetical protein
VSPGRCTSPPITVNKEHIISTPKLFFATALAMAAIGTPLAQAATDHTAYPPGPTVQAAAMFPPGPTAQAAAMFPPGPSSRAIIAV